MRASQRVLVCSELCYDHACAQAGIAESRSLIACPGTRAPQGRFYGPPAVRGPNYVESDVAA